MNNQGNWIYFDHKFVAKTSEDKSFIAENSIYEVIRIIEQKPLFFEDHITRFRNSIKNLNLDFLIDENHIRSILKELSNKNDTLYGNIKLDLLIKKNVDPVLCAYFIPFFYPPENWYFDGIEIITYVIERKDPHIKQSIVNNNIRKQIQSIKEENNYYEILLVNNKQQITEGSRSNVFFIKNNTLFSPPSKDLLEGITRKKILELINQSNKTFIEQEISIDNLSDFDACFISGTSPKILPVKKINSIVFDTENNLLQELIIGYNKLISDYIIQSNL